MSPGSYGDQDVGAAAAAAAAATAATANAGEAARTIALQMLEERGRGAVLVGVARVDVALERLLQAVLLPPPGSTDTFFQPDRPLGSFGARITLAARLGLIDQPVEQALRTLRRVRNAFAHSTTTATLADPSHADRLAQAYAAARSNTLWQPLERILQEGDCSPPWGIQWLTAWRCSSCQARSRSIRVMR